MIILSRLLLQESLREKNWTKNGQYKVLFRVHRFAEIIC